MLWKFCVGLVAALAIAHCMQSVVGQVSLPTGPVKIPKHAWIFGNGPDANYWKQVLVQASLTFDQFDAYEPHTEQKPRCLIFTESDTTPVGQLGQLRSTETAIIAVRKEAIASLGLCSGEMAIANDATLNYTAFTDLAAFTSVQATLGDPPAVRTCAAGDCPGAFVRGAEAVTGDPAVFGVRPGAPLVSGPIATGARLFWGGFHAYTSNDAPLMMLSAFMWTSRNATVAPLSTRRVGEAFSVTVTIITYDGYALSIGSGTPVRIELITPTLYDATMTGTLEATTAASSQRITMSVAVDALVPGARIRAYCPEAAKNCGEYVSAPFDILEAAPIVVSVDPASAPLEGGRTVVIEGTNFGTDPADLVEVSMGSVACASFVWVSPVQINCTVGSSDVRLSVSVVVRTFRGGTQVGTVSFHYAEPRVDAIDPTEGPSQGLGNPSITIIGQDLGFVAADVIGVELSSQNAVPIACGNINHNNLPSAISCTTPDLPLGSLTVTVNTTNGVVSGNYTALPPPAITGLDPTIGNVGGTVLTVTGVNLGVDAADLLVVFLSPGYTPCVVNAGLSAFNTQVVCDVPARQAGTEWAINIITTRGGFNSTVEGAFRIAHAPQFQSIDPVRGPIVGGTSVVVSGSNLGLNLNDTSVTIGGAPCTITDASGLPFSVTCTTTAPSNQSAPVAATVSVETVSGGPEPFASGVRAFYFGVMPKILGGAPSVGPPVGGVRLTIVGSDLGVDASDIAGVSIGGRPCMVLATQRLPNRVLVETPNGTDHSLATVVYTTHSGGTRTLPGAYAYNSTVPFVTAVAEASGPTAGLQEITLSGFFNGAAVTSVTINGSACVGATGAGLPDHINCTTGPSPSGRYFPVVEIDGVAGVSQAAYTYSGIPFVVSVDPPFVPPDQAGVPINLTGTDLGAELSDVIGCSVGGAPCVLGPASGYYLPTALACVAPPLPAGEYDIQCNTTSGGAGLVNARLAYAAHPFVTSISPTLGPAIGGGPPLRVLGYNLGLTTEIEIGGLPCPVVDGSDAMNVTCSVPGGPVSVGNDVTVAVGGGDDNGYVASAVSYEWVAAPVISNIEPTKGVEAGGTAVTLTGSNLGRGLDDVVRVTIGATDCLPVAWVSSTRLTCVTQGNGGVSAVEAVEVETVAGGAGAGPATFAYVGLPLVTSVDPEEIPLWGGERLTVFGNNLGYELADLESLTVAGVSCSALSVTGSPITEVVCASTPPAPSVAAAGVTVVTAFGTGSLPAPSVYNCQNGPGVADCETCQALHDTCGWCDQSAACGGGGDCVDLLATCPSVTGVTPAGSPLGGGIQINVTGTGFVERSSGLQCVFGSFKSPVSTVVDDSLVTCITPPQFSVGSAPFRLTRFGNDDYVPGAAPIGFSYYDCGVEEECAACAEVGPNCNWCPLSHSCVADGVCLFGEVPAEAPEDCPALTSTAIDAAPRSGNLLLKVNGTNLQPPAEDGRIRCQFGTGERIYEERATVVSLTQLQCLSPVIAFDDLSPPVQMTVRYDNTPFAASPLFDFSFYDCTTATACASCADAGAECVWCGASPTDGDCQSAILPCDDGVVASSACHSAGSSDAGILADDNQAEGGFPLVPVVAGGAALIVCCLVGAAVCCWTGQRSKRELDSFFGDDVTVKASDNALGEKVKKAMRKNARRIGGGLNSVVYRVKMGRETVCLKVITTDSKEARLEYHREVQALSRLVSLEHPAVVELKFFVKDDPICIAMEFCPGGDLKSLIKTKPGKLNDAEVCRLAFQIASGIRAVHLSGIAHLDIKTANVLLDARNNAKICDFGIARFCDDFGNSLASAEFVSTLAPPKAELGGNRGAATLSGFETISTLGDGSSIAAQPSYNREEELAFTPQYVDPMRILHRSLSSAGSTAPGERRASVAAPLNLYKCDVFSFGCVLWAMVERAEPHAGKEPESLVQRYEVDPYFRLPLPETGDEAIAEIIDECWDRQPDARPTFNVLTTRLANILEMAHGVVAGADYVRDLDVDRTVAYHTLNPIFGSSPNGSMSSGHGREADDDDDDDDGDGSVGMSTLGSASLANGGEFPGFLNTAGMETLPPPPPPPSDAFGLPPPLPSLSGFDTFVPPPPPPEDSDDGANGGGIEMSTFAR